VPNAQLGSAVPGSCDSKLRHPPDLGPACSGSRIACRAVQCLSSPENRLVWGSPVMLVTLAALNAIFTWATVLDARRASALMRAHGARVRQVSRGWRWPRSSPRCWELLLAFRWASACSRWRPGGNGGGTPDVLWLVAAAFGTLTVLGGLTSVPACIDSRRSIVEVLQSE
jgi:putative ABC transport system permease protein